MHRIKIQLYWWIVHQLLYIGIIWFLVFLDKHSILRKCLKFLKNLYWNEKKILKRGSFVMWLASIQHILRLWKFLFWEYIHYIFSKFQVSPGLKCFCTVSITTHASSIFFSSKISQFQCSIDWLFDWLIDWLIIWHQVEVSS